MPVRPVEPVDIWSLVKMASDLRAREDEAAERKLRLEEHKYERDKRIAKEKATYEYLQTQDPEKKKRAEIDLLALDSDVMRDLEQLRGQKIQADTSEYKLKQAKLQDKNELMANILHRATQTGTLDSKAVNSGIAAILDQYGPEEAQKFSGTMSNIMQMPPEQRFAATRELLSQYDMQLPLEKKTKTIARDLFASSFVAQKTGMQEARTNPALASSQHPELYNIALGMFDAQQAKKGGTTVNIQNMIPGQPTPPDDITERKLIDGINASENAVGIASAMLEILNNPKYNYMTGKTGAIVRYGADAVQSVAGPITDLGAETVATAQTFDSMSKMLLMNTVTGWAQSTFTDQLVQLALDALGNLSMTDKVKTTAALQTFISDYRRTMDQNTAGLNMGPDPQRLLTDAQRTAFSEQILKTLSGPTDTKKDKISQQMQISALGLQMRNMSKINSQMMSNVRQWRQQLQTTSDPKKAAELRLQLGKVSPDLIKMVQEQEQGVNQEIQNPVVYDRKLDSFME